MPHVPGSMSLNPGPIPIRKTVKQAVTDFQNIAKSRITQAPDCEIVGGMSDNQILQWDPSKGAGNIGAFTNVDVASVNVFTSPKCKEYIVADTGNDNNTGEISGDAFLTFQKAVSQCGKNDAYDMTTIYVTGDIVWDPASGSNTSMRLRESSFGGNLARGLVIRGLGVGQITSKQPTNGNPRIVASTLVPIGIVPTTTFTKLVSNSNGTTVRFNSSASQPDNIEFYKDQGTSEYYPVTFDKSDNVSADIKNNNKAIYMSDKSTLPSMDGQDRIDVELVSHKFAGKVTLNNGGATTNPGFSISGNVQFVEVEVKLQDGVITPYSVSGELNILYSKFSKTSGGGGATLELSTYGGGTDHLATLQVVPPNAIKEGGRVIHIIKSIFEDLTIKFDSVVEINNCVFKNCTISNPQHATFDGCTFYNCSVKLGNETDSFAFGSMAEIDKSQFIYSPAGNTFSISKSSTLEMEDIYVLPMTTAAAVQTVPLISNEKCSNVDIINLIYPDSNNGASISTPSAIITSGTGKVSVSGVKIITTSVYPLIYVNGGSATIGTFNADTTSNGEIVHTIGSSVGFTNFSITDGKYTNTNGGVFRFDSSDVKIGETFDYIMNSGVTTTESIFVLNNSSLTNYPGGSGVGKFNIQNEESKNAIKSIGSILQLGIGINAPQLDIHGGIDLRDSAMVLEAASDTSFKIDYQDTTGEPTIKLVNSKITLRNLDIQNSAGASTALDITNGGNAYLNSCNINVTGYTGKKFN